MNRRTFVATAGSSLIALSGCADIGFGDEDDGDGDGDNDGNDDGSESTFIGDTFESDHGMEQYTLVTRDADTYEIGTATSDAPDDGTTHGYVTEGDRGQGTRVTVFSEDTAAWDRSYQFEFLVRCSDYNPDGPYNATFIGWRTDDDREIDQELGVNMFHTDPGGGARPFKLTGGGVLETNSHEVEWDADTWYWVRGEVEERPEADTGRAAAKLWRAGESEPEEYQVSTPVTNGVSSAYPFYVSVDGRLGQNTVTLDTARATWTQL